MLLTEKEAKGKWCRHSVLPIVKRGHGEIVGVENVAVNRFTNEETGARCIGSGCMAWRWGNFSDTIGFCGADPVMPVRGIAK
jgi:hypothetical protein